MIAFTAHIITASERTVAIAAAAAKAAGLAFVPSRAAKSGMLLECKAAAKFG